MDKERLKKALKYSFYGWPEPPIYAVNNEPIEERKREAAQVTVDTAKEVIDNYEKHKKECKE